ncbi:MAG: tetratricopeptide repeat protein [Candidatus Obscuribacter sp.]|nr:tetratricopeptide repeat protein [Candidatus Obscuribacter sp.]MBP6594553.1 tetratricopeptide repeat protein [Candidatus Obscuribacter sp.]MBP7577754.1 tetratricopeptide repeat protein [Candidatus Obscuribacter sp.]
MSRNIKPDNSGSLSVQIATRAIFASLILSSLTVPCQAQGMMEYGSLLAAPKALPSSGTINALTRPFSSYTLPGGAPPAVNGAAAGGQLAPYQIMGADGNPQIDPKKVKLIADKAAKAYELAKAKAKITSPTAKDLKDAETSLREAITLRNSVWGYQDPAIPGMLNMLGDIYEKQKQTQSAESCYKSALVYINHRSGSGSYERVDTLNNLARLYEKNGQNKEALDNYAQVGTIRERQNGENSLLAIKSRLNWARVAGLMDKPEAEALFERCLKSVEKADRQKEADGYKKVVSELAVDYPAYLARHERATLLSEVKVRIAALESAPAATTIAPDDTTSAPVSKSAGPGGTSAVQVNAPASVLPGTVASPKDSVSNNAIQKGDAKATSQKP